MARSRREAEFKFGNRRPAGERPSSVIVAKSRESTNIGPDEGIQAEYLF
jgi:hypothetical protein